MLTTLRFLFPQDSKRQRFQFLFTATCLLIQINPAAVTQPLARLRTQVLFRHHEKQLPGKYFKYINHRLCQVDHVHFRKAAFVSAWPTYFSPHIQGPVWSSRRVSCQNFQRAVTIQTNGHKDLAIQHDSFSTVMVWLHRLHIHTTSLKKGLLSPLNVLLLI